MAQSANIRQLLAISYVVITLPAVVFVVYLTQAIDNRIDLAHQTAFDADAFAMATRPANEWLIGIGAGLRRLNLPLATSPSVIPDSPYNLTAALELSDYRASLIYLWLLIFIVGACVVWWLGSRLNKPLSGLTEAIGRLAREELVNPVVIRGPRNIREMSEGLEKLRTRLKASDMQQTQFLRHISHEIKTPLTSIKEGAKLLDDELLGSINEEQREITEILNKSTRELQTSIENLLNYNSAISVDKIKQRQTTDIAHLVHQAVDKQALQIKNKGVKLKLSLTPARAFVDRQQVLTVFDNLLSNAVKFSPNGDIIQIWLKRTENQVSFIIRDNGPGVPAKHHKAIFDAFFVGEQTTKTTLKGTGLGLSIARQYVDLHKGSIDLLSTRKGAAFRVTFNC